MAIRRRDFIKIIGGAVAWPLGARAQQPIPVIGCLGAGSPAGRSMPAFRQGLSEAGYVEGRNVLVEYRWSEGRYERLTQLAAELVSRPVTAIFAVGSALPALAQRRRARRFRSFSRWGSTQSGLGLSRA